VLAVNVKREALRGNIEKEEWTMVTIYDVAKEAGVSHTTVSRVLNRKKSGISISEETRKKVMEAAKRLNYTPNRAARNLSTGQTNCFCFLLCDRLFTNLYYYSLLKVIEEELSKRGMGLLFAIYKEDEDLPPMLKERAVDGILVTGRVTQKIVSAIKGINIPFIVLGTMADKEYEVNQVQSDVKDDVMTMYSYLLGYGHQEIAYLTDYKEELLIQKVVDGCKLAYEQYNLKPRLHLLKTNVRDPYTVIDEILSEHKEITALIIQSHFVSAFSNFVRERGLDIPDKVSVIMCNDESLDNAQRTYFNHLPGGSKEMGEEGVKSLIELSRGRMGKINITIPKQISQGHTVKKILVK